MLLKKIKILKKLKKNFKFRKYFNGQILKEIVKQNCKTDIV